MNKRRGLVNHQRKLVLALGLRRGILRRINYQLERLNKKRENIEQEIDVLSHEISRIEIELSKVK